MEEDEFTHTEDLTVNKDQADCLLIILTQHQGLLDRQIENFNNLDIRAKQVLEFSRVAQIEPEQALEKLKEADALNHSLKATIPGILDELRELYPMLQEKSTVESRIKIIKPSWERKQ